MIVQGKVWGLTTSLFKNNSVEVHLIHCKKGGYCSKHYHKTKYNKFFVISGKLKITIWKDYVSRILEDVTILEAGQECTVSPGDLHRFEVLEDTQALEIYFVDLKEDDIVRKDHGGLIDETKTTECLEDTARGTKGMALAHNLGLSERTHREGWFSQM